MNRLLMITVSAATLAAAVPTLASAKCSIGSEAAFSDADRSVNSGEVRRDLRTLRSAAMTLRDYGKDDACETVVAAIAELREDPGAEQVHDQRAGKATGDNAEAYQRTFGERAAARMTDAKPLSEVSARMSANQLIGADLVGPGNESVGEIEDVVLSPDGKSTYAVVGFGGFLGLGEEQVAIPFDTIKVGYDVDGNATYFIPLTAEQLETAPRFKRQSYDWVKDDNWRTENDSFYEKFNG